MSTPPYTPPNIPPEPSDVLAALHLVAERTVDYYMRNEGPDEARKQLKALMATQMYQDGANGVYRDMMARINRYEEELRNPPPPPVKCPELPPELKTEKAMELWQKAQEAELVDENYQPTISKPLSAVMAHEMAVRLKLKQNWKPFKTLWKRTDPYRDYWEACDQKQTLKFIDKLREIFD